MKLCDQELGEGPCVVKVHVSGWRHSEKASAPVPVARDVLCEMSSRRESDKARHKCTVERKKPVHEQQGAVRCQKCHR